jgi:hypothetical protein
MVVLRLLQGNGNFWDNFLELFSANKSPAKGRAQILQLIYLCKKLFVIRSQS